MPLIYLPELRLNAEISGPETAPALVLLHGLGLDMSLWQPLITLLPHHRILRIDLRGHGQSDAPPPPYKMGGLIRDVEQAIEHFKLRDTVVVGAGLGGLIAQGLAVKRLDLVRALVLSNTATRIGFAGQWQEQIAAVTAADNLESLIAPTMERWFGRLWRDNLAMPAAQTCFAAQSVAGWLGTAAAIAGTDFYETTAALRLPALVIASGNDGVTPADLVRETADLIPGSQFVVIQGAGHLPMLEKPAELAAVLASFLTRIGHD